MKIQRELQMLLRKKLQALEDPLKDAVSNYPSGESNRSLGMKVGEGLIMSVTVTYMISPGINKFCLLQYYYYYYYYYRISHFSALAGKYSPILGCVNQQD